MAKPDCCKVLVRVEPPIFGDLLERRLAREPTLRVTRTGATRDVDPDERWDVTISTNGSDGTVRVDPGPSCVPSRRTERSAASETLDEVVAEVLLLCTGQLPNRE
jgi:hypothetical protein